MRTAAAASRSASWTERARQPAREQQSRGERTRRTNSNTLHRELVTPKKRPADTEVGCFNLAFWASGGLQGAPGGLQVVPQDIQGTSGDPRGSSVSAGLSDPYIVLLVEPGEQPVPDLGGRWHSPGDSGGHSRGSRWSPGGTPGVLSVQGVPWFSRSKMQEPHNATSRLQWRIPTELGGRSRSKTGKRAKGGRAGRGCPERGRRVPFRRENSKMRNTHTRMHDVSVLYRPSMLKCFK